MSEIQSIAFDRKLWTPKKAKFWLKIHNHKIINRVDGKYLRWIIQKPIDIYGIRVKDVGEGIRMLVGFKTI